MLTSLGTGFLTGLTLIVAIGAQNAFVLRQGLRREHVPAVVALCAAADAALITAGVAGLGALLESYPAATDAARYGGAAFLIVYGALAARRALNPRGMTASQTAPGTRTAALLTCLAFTFLNPHVYLDTVILLGSLGNQHGADGRWPFVAGASAASLTWFVALGYGARALSGLFARPASWRVLDGAIAGVMLTLAGGLLAG